MELHDKGTDRLLRDMGVQPEGSFMRKQETTGTYYAIETNNGTTFIPADVCGGLLGCERGVMYYNPSEACDYDRFDQSDIDDQFTWDSWCDQLRNYVDGLIESIEERAGTLYRLSAPGYMDCAEWTTDPNSPEFDDDEPDGFDDIDEPTEPDEDDATITPCGRLGGMTAAAIGGKFLGEFQSDAAALNAIRRQAKRDGWFPNVWSISDHGNAHLMTDFRYDLFDSED